MCVCVWLYLNYASNHVRELTQCYFCTVASRVMWLTRQHRKHADGEGVRAGFTDAVNSDNVHNLNAGTESEWLDGSVEGAASWQAHTVATRADLNTGQTEGRSCVCLESWGLVVLLFFLFASAHNQTCCSDFCEWLAACSGWLVLQLTDYIHVNVASAHLVGFPSFHADSNQYKPGLGRLGECCMVSFWG